MPESCMWREPGTCGGGRPCRLPPDHYGPHIPIERCKKIFYHDYDGYVPCPKNFGHEGQCDYIGLMGHRGPRGADDNVPIYISNPKKILHHRNKTVILKQANYKNKNKNVKENGRETSREGCQPLHDAETGRRKLILLLPSQQKHGRIVQQ